VSALPLSRARLSRELSELIGRPVEPALDPDNLDLPESLDPTPQPLVRPHELLGLNRRGSLHLVDQEPRVRPQHGRGRAEAGGVGQREDCSLVLRLMMRAPAQWDGSDD
jgi:hypothetical protein